jgi:hypothetical protein
VTSSAADFCDSSMSAPTGTELQAAGLYLAKFFTAAQLVHICDGADRARRAVDAYVRSFIEVSA